MPLHSNQPVGMEATEPDHITITPEGTRFSRLFWTNAVVAICVLLVPLAAVGATATPLKVDVPEIERLLPLMLAPLILPVADTVPFVITLPAVRFPVAEIKPVDNKLPPCRLPPARLPTLTLPDAVIVVMIASLDLTVPVALMSPEVRKLPPCTLPVTERLVSVPTDVIAGWAAVLNVPPNVNDVTWVAVIVPAVKTLLTVRLFKAPIWVMLGWLGVCSTPLMRVAVTVPDVITPVQLRVATVPIEVMLG